jgi:hypothetical protein
VTGNPEVIRQSLMFLIWPPRYGGEVMARKLFYITLDGRLVSVPFSVASGGQVAETGSPIPLFTARVGAIQDMSLQEYIVSPDGDRFLMDTALEEMPSPINVILNWKSVSN